MNKIAIVLLSALAAGGALAQTPEPARPAPVPAARGPALELALEAARAAVDACAAQEQKIGVSVVDAAGVLKVLLASDGASARGVQSSTAKAVTALAFKTATGRLFEQAKTDKDLADRIAANSAYNGRPGGILLRAGDEVIGAIGVGGARIDEPCAQAGLDRVQSRLQQPGAMANEVAD